MPTKPKRPCARPGCNNLVEHGYCQEHKRKRPPEQRVYGSKWRQAARMFLSRHPLCAMCEAQGRIVAAECVDHIIPHKGDMVLFWDVCNWQPLCSSCHSVKTWKENNE